MDGDGKWIKSKYIIHMCESLLVGPITLYIEKELIQGQNKRMKGGLNMR
jgi:hypothetical protein